MFGRENREIAAVFVGGAIGTLGRAALASTAVDDPGHWPWPTFIANVIGSVLLGFIGTRLATSDLRRPLWGTGLCGGLTTFSTVQVETLLMIQGHHYGLAAGYTAAGIAAGLLAVNIARGPVKR